MAAEEGIFFYEEHAQKSTDQSLVLCDTVRYLPESFEIPWNPNTRTEVSTLSPPPAIPGSGSPADAPSAQFAVPAISPANGLFRAPLLRCFASRPSASGQSSARGRP